jgi:hypothetical protein
MMPQTHVAGDKLFVDWAGDTVPIRKKASEVNWWGPQVQ